MFKKILIFLFLLGIASGVYAQTLSSEQYNIEQKYGEVQNYNFNLQLEQDDTSRIVYASWNEFPEEKGFKWYKLLYSTNVTNPVYPNQAAVFVGTGRGQTETKFQLKSGTTHYIRLCAITENEIDSDRAYSRYCSETQKIVVKQEEEPRVCTMEYAPVCGKKNGAYQTYSNNCMREAAGASKVDNKYCEQDTQICTQEYAPMCGRPVFECPENADCMIPQPVTYENKCMLKAAGADFLYAGKCTVEQPKACTREYMPVCAEKNGNKSTFGNKCTMEAEGAKYLYAGECKKEIDNNELSVEMKKKIDALITDFMQKLKAKGYSNEKIVQTINIVIQKLEVLGKQDKYRAIVVYMIDLLEEYRSKYEDDFSILKDIFGEY